MILRLDKSSQSPLYAQIAAQLRRAIAAGDLDVGQRLPSARDLADDLDVNMHTVLRAYAQLRDDGLVEMRRGRGVRVQQSGDLHAQLVESARRLAKDASRLGMTPAEVRALVERQL